MTRSIADLLGNVFPLTVIIAVHLVVKSETRSLLNSFIDQAIDNRLQQNTATNLHNPVHLAALKDTSIAMADLVHHTKSAYSLLCRTHPLPSEDPSLSSCDGYAKFISDFHGPALDLPPMHEVVVPETVSTRHFAEEVLSTVLTVATRYRYVVANITTFESTHICLHDHGLETCRMNCQLEHHAFWCHCHKLQTRLNSLVALVKYSMRSLGLSDRAQSERVLVQSAPDSRQIIRIYYSFGAIYRLIQQGEHMRNIIQLTVNLMN